MMNVDEKIEYIIIDFANYGSITNKEAISAIKSLVRKSLPEKKEYKLGSARTVRDMMDEFIFEGFNACVDYMEERWSDDKA